MADAEKALTEAKSKRAEGKEAEGIMSDQAALAALAQADLIRYRLERAEVRAPITGEILKSDVTDKRGAPVKIGDPLFEIAAKDKLRVQLAVAERDIQRVFVGQKGHIATNALPGKKFPITVERIVPMGEAKEGANVFKVFATLDDASPDWRPGMAGEARLDTQHASLAWQWSHRLIDFIRLKLWI
jgi:multidrug resistance efflux pump